MPTATQSGWKYEVGWRVQIPSGVLGRITSKTYFLYSGIVHKTYDVQLDVGIALSTFLEHDLRLTTTQEIINAWRATQESLRMEVSSRMACTDEAG